MRRAESWPLPSWRGASGPEPLRSSEQVRFPRSVRQEVSAESLIQGHRSIELLPYDISHWPDIRAGGFAIPSSFKQRFGTNALALVVVLLSVFGIYYIFQTLLLQSPRLGPLLLSASGTLVTVTALSAILSYLQALLLTQVFDTLRYQLASRPGGLSLEAFLALGGGTSIVGVFRLCFAKGSHIFWCMQRYKYIQPRLGRIFFHFICAFATIVITANINFTNVYTPGPTVNVLAGLAPMNVSLLSDIPVAIVNIYFATWSYGFLGSSQFVTPVDCQPSSGDNCTGIFLPGGLILARLDQRNLNLTLLTAGSPLSDASVITINGAIGFELDFFELDKDFAFNKTSDCVTYGQGNGQGTYLCIAAINDFTIAAGWSYCPTDIYFLGRCFLDTSWQRSLAESTAMSFYKRNATVSYDTQSQNILTIESISSPSLGNLNPLDFHNIYSYTLNQSTFNASADAIQKANEIQTEATLFDLGWVTRLYHDDFPADTQVPRDLFRGFLAIPLQFGTAAWEFANASHSLDGDKYALPQYMETTASATRTRYRALAAPWTVYLYISLVGLSTLWATSITIITFFPVGPNTSSFSDIDISSKSGHLNTTDGRGLHTEYGLALRIAGLSNASTRELMPFIRGHTIRICHIEGLTNRKYIVSIIKANGEHWDSNAGLRVLERENGEYV